MRAVSVTQINEYIARKIDKDLNLQNLPVEGEITGITRKGHVYFTLKDENSVIRAVIWRNQVPKIDPKLLVEGKNVIAVGSVRVWIKGGSYSYQVNYMEDAGEGKAKTAFELLKRKLEKEGLFDPKYKKPLPPFPKTVGIVTSTEGDALRDIRKIITKKNSYVDMLVFPSYVQGIYAPDSLCEGIRQANEVNDRGRKIDVLIVGRGGGSAEDLEAFNDERVARAIFESKIPVISAVGHEPDFTIADFTADRRAATPSEAAEIAVPNTYDLKDEIDTLEKGLLDSLRAKIRSSRQITEASEQLLYANMQNRLRRARMEMEKALITLREGHPKRILDKGYAAVLDQSGAILSDIDRITVGGEYTILLRSGSFRAAAISKERNADDER